MNLRYYFGIDGGGTHTRLRLTDAQGTILCEISGGPSALGQGVEAAWEAIHALVETAWHTAHLPPAPRDHCALSIGISGIHNPNWAHAFKQQAQHWGRLLIHSDAATMLVGAHAGQPGLMMIVGTGSVAEAWLPDGRYLSVGGWGFPLGDEASGAWLGIGAMQHWQKVQDGRVAADVLSTQISQHLGISPEMDSAEKQQILFNWLAPLKQHALGQLAPLVFANAHLPSAHALLHAAAQAIADHIAAIDRCSHPTLLPICLCGGLANVIQPYLKEDLRHRIHPTQGDALDGALHLLHLPTLPHWASPPP